MSTENKSTQDDIPTVDLDIDNTSKESPASQSTENTGSDENGNNSPSDADEQTDVELHYDGDYDNAGFDWVGEGQHISIERVSETETEILLRTHVEESIGLASMILNPAELRAMHLQLGSVIESQNYESWVAYGNDPDDYQPVVNQDYDVEDGEDSGEEEDDAGRGRWSKVKDPANVESMVGALDADSPVTGMSWKTLILVGFIALTIISLTISGIS